MAVAAAPFPTPVFEGSEKRIEIGFAPAAGYAAAVPSLRSLSRPQLDSILELAACCIVSSRNGAEFDAYVLSESSLFVYPRKAILKTCGTTRLLAAVPALIAAAAGIGLEPCRAKYSRASFLFPEQQPQDLHASFPQETRLLQKAFAPMGGISGAHVLGDTLAGLQWHVYVAEGPAAAQWHNPTYTLEVCMTGLAPEKAAQFFRGPDYVSSQATTEQSGIRALLPKADIDDYVFEPCGYSMNGIKGAQCSTIHITPEEGFSYASVEVSCQDMGDIDASQLVSQIADIFGPAELAVVMTVDGAAADCSWGAGASLPNGYTAVSRTVQDIRAGGRVTYINLASDAATAAPLKLLPITAAAEDEMVSLRSASLEAPPVPDSREGGPSAYSSDSEGCDSDNCMPVAKKPQQLVAPCSGPAWPASDLTSAVMAAHSAVPVPAVDAAALDTHIAELIAANRLDDTFYVMDLGVVAALATAWRQLMPRVRPFYAVKCNGDPALLSVLAAAGANFDCASEAEIRAVMELGVMPDRIIFANACKRPSDIKAARECKVLMTTADSESELRKIAVAFPEAQVLLRIRQDDPSARCQLGNKYGAEEEDIQGLLVTAKSLNLDLAGVSFHVGSGASNPDALPQGIAAAAAVFASAAQLGFNMRVLDVGGGFPGGAISANGRVDLGCVPEAVNAALATYFPEGCGVDIIAEPGRFFAEACATLVCQVFGHRSRLGTKLEDESTAVDYYITDGLYGSFNCVLYDHAEPTARALRSPLLPPAPAEADKVHLSTVFGPSCDGLDTLFKSYPLPQLRNGDWLVFPAMGAYTLCGASNFNGIKAADAPTFYVQSQLTDC